MKALRFVFIGAGGFAGLVFVLFASLVLPRGHLLAVLLFDMQEAALQSFPYPFTIQNLMHLLFFAGMGELAWRVVDMQGDRRALRGSNLPTDDRTVLLKTDFAPYREAAMERHPKAFLTRLIDQCTLRFMAQGTASEAQELLGTLLDLELTRMESRYTLVRYLAWLLPTVGFIGTVTGISMALAAAGSGAEIDLPVITSKLSVAFFTTLLALLQSSVVVLAYEMLRAKEEDHLVDSAEHCVVNLLNRVYTPDAA